MTLADFIGKQFIDVIEWNEPQDGILSYRYPMRDLEIQNGGQLTVSESQQAAFVNEGKIADVFGPGLHTLNTRNLPILTRRKFLGWSQEGVPRLAPLPPPRPKPRGCLRHSRRLPPDSLPVLCSRRLRSGSSSSRSSRWRCCW